MREERCKTTDKWEGAFCGRNVHGSGWPAGRVGPDQDKVFKIKYGGSGRVENFRNVFSFFVYCPYLLTTFAESSSQCFSLPYGLRAYALLRFALKIQLTASSSVGRVGSGRVRSGRVQSGRVGSGRVSIFSVIGGSGLVWSSLKFGGSGNR